MNAILVKIFATALAFSQVTTRPDAVKTQFDPVQDQGEVIRLLQAGCAHIREVFKIEDINFDDLITTAMDDPQAMSGGIKALHGLKFDELFTVYRQFCKNETVTHSPVDIGDAQTIAGEAGEGFRRLQVRCSSAPSIKSCVQLRTSTSMTLAIGTPAHPG